MTMRVIDLNADLGELPDSLENGHDAELMRYVTSANVACGGHAGDEQTMRRTLELARESRVAVGAHPSYPDREHFGREAMQIAAAALERSLREQVESLRVIALQVGVRVGHVKPHGALYHAANNDAEVARMLSRVVLSLDSSMIMVVQAGSPAADVYRAMGLRVAYEAFADRRYEDDGTLRNRKLAGAVLDSPEEAARQAASIALDAQITGASGAQLTVRAETLCVHSDTAQSVAIAREIRRVLATGGVRVQSLSE
jgi:5-oxoprolinase (ATP-hydrolysing) subunit A